MQVNFALGSYSVFMCFFTTKLKYYIISLIEGFIMLNKSGLPNFYKNFLLINIKLNANLTTLRHPRYIIYQIYQFCGYTCLILILIL